MRRVINLKFWVISGLWTRNEMSTAYHTCTLSVNPQFTRPTELHDERFGSSLSRCRQRMKIDINASCSNAIHHLWQHSVLVSYEDTPWVEFGTSLKHGNHVAQAP